MKIKLNKDTGIDLDKLIESRLLIQANSGGGKSHTIRRIIEQAFKHVQIIVIDPEGEFGNLRSALDFVYIGKDGDAPAESRSASLLARRLLELKASAIIDLYELSPQERKHFVKLFCQQLVDAPKELWHDVLVIIDEAHVFAPEKGESEAMGAVIDLATRGRKRGFCAILATQRISKLNKDAAAECNNKLIGRASLDIDRKRSAEELGFTTKDDVRNLRDLNPGEFYVFGPAIGRDVIKIVVGDVSVKPEKRGASRATPPPPTAKVKKILAKLADLPQAAQEEAKTIQGLQAQLRAAKAQMKAVERPGMDLDLVNKVSNTVRNNERKNLARIKNDLFNRLGRAQKIIQDVLADLREEATRGVVHALFDGEKLAKEIGEDIDRDRVKSGGVSSKELSAALDSVSLGQGEKKVLMAIAQHFEGASRELITLVTGYKRSTRDAYIQRLQLKGYVRAESEAIRITPEGVSALGAFEALPTGRELAEHYLKTLPEGERKVFETLYHWGDPLTREQISVATGYKRSTRDAYIQRLRLRQLVIPRGDSMLQASLHLYEPHEQE